MDQKRNRFSPIGVLLDALVGSFLGTLARSQGWTGKYTPPKPPTSDFYILSDWFIDRFIVFFFFIYFLHIIGVWPLNGLCLMMYRESRHSKLQNKDKQRPDAKKLSGDRKRLATHKKQK